MRVFQNDALYQHINFGNGFIAFVALWKYILGSLKSKLSIWDAHFGLIVISKKLQKIAVLSDFQIFQKTSSKSEFCAWFQTNVKN